MDGRVLVSSSAERWIDPSILKGLYKSAAFVLQAKHFGVTGQYLRRQGDLLPLLSPEDRGILEISLALKKRALAEGELEPLSERLFLWAGDLIINWFAVSRRGG